jgi:hypothetical protein
MTRFFLFAIPCANYVHVPFIQNRIAHSLPLLTNLVERLRNDLLPSDDKPRLKDQSLKEQIPSRLFGDHHRHRRRSGLRRKLSGLLGRVLEQVQLWHAAKSCPDYLGFPGVLRPLKTKFTLVRCIQSFPCLIFTVVCITL